MFAFFSGVLAVWVGWAVAQTTSSQPQSTPSSMNNIAQADFAALNAALYNFSAYFNGSVKILGGDQTFCSDPAPSPPPPLVYFDVCFRGCVQFQCNNQGRPTTLVLGRPDFDIELDERYFVNSIHPAIGNLNALTSLEITLPPPVVWVSEMARLTNLRFFTITESTYFRNGTPIPFPGAGIQMTLPTFLGSLSNLVRLAVQSRSLVALPTEIGLLPSLTSLDLLCPNLTSIPSEIGLLANLTNIRLNIRSGELPSAFDGKRFFGFDAVNANLSGKLPLFVFDGPADACQLRGNKFDTTTSLCPFGCQCDRTVVLQPPLTLPTPPTTESTTTSATTTTTLLFVAPDELSSALATLTMTFAIAIGAVGTFLLICFIVMCIVIVKLRGRLASNSFSGEANVEQRAAASPSPSPYTTLPRQSGQRPVGQQPAAQPAYVEFASTRSERQIQIPPPIGTEYVDMGKPPAASGYYTGDQVFSALHQQNNFQ
jgi:hypothetical protein